MTGTPCAKPSGRWSTMGVDAIVDRAVSAVEPPWEPPEEAGLSPSLFRRYSMSELLLEPDHFDWLISGLLADPTYGQAAGEMKTLKSTLVGLIEVGLASGTPISGQFAPREPRPVLPYVGEGGRRLWTRRIRRISAAMGVTP